MSDIRRKAVSGIQEGDTFTVTRTFSREEVHRFADLSRDYNPVHFDDRFASAKNFKGVICHGLLVGSMLTEVGGQIGWLASGMEMRFKRPVYFGDTVTCRLTIVETAENGKSRADIIWYNQAGLTVIEGVLTGFLPGPAEKRILKAMMAEGDPTNKLYY